MTFFTKDIHPDGGKNLMSEIDRTEMIKAKYSCAVAADGNSIVLLAERSP